MIQTTLHVYHFDTRNPEEAKAWQELKEKLSSGPRRMKSHGGKSHYLSGPAGACRMRSLGGKSYYLSGACRPIQLETAHLFDNQWNTVCGHRVFDWAQDYTERSTLKQGHYLEQTEEMREIRRSTYACGYCGKQERPSKNKFCQHCLGSEYLTEDNLLLLRMKAVSDNSEHQKLTQAEKDYLTPLYVEAQTRRTQEQLAKLRSQVLADAEAAISKANTERDGKLWLIDRGINLDNVIFYNHTGKFQFGWRKPLQGGVLKQTKELLANFPYAHTIKE